MNNIFCYSTYNELMIRKLYEYGWWIYELKKNLLLVAAMFIRLVQDFGLESEVDIFIHFL